MSTVVVTIKISLGDNPDIGCSANEQRCTVSIDEILIESKCAEEMKRLGLACIEAARAKELAERMAGEYRRAKIEEQYAKTFAPVAP